ncbi:MAG TPA: LLM class F420-dependent oxidoreductase [Ktedonobacteraceae bacterium]|jgi:F420-dependent oxidoreductase-like protein|nr:LLM class F420-dependent oxidoreductase [Ktedonobacteraceae bacterium]
MKLSFGIKTAPQFTTYDDILRVWNEADRLPEIEHAWAFDHFIPLGPDPTGPQLEGWTLLGALAARTERLRLGLMVTGNIYRHPAVLANIGATVDVISHGRLDFGIGAGWNEMECNMYGIPLYAPGERIRRLGEACEVIKLLWTEPRANFNGKYYQLRDALCEPKPVQKPYPPFVIGGSGEQLTLRVVAKYANIWNFAGGSVETFQHKNEVLNGYCKEIGRDPQTIQRSIQTRMNYNNLSESIEQMRPYIQEGASHIVLNLTAPYPENIVHRLVEEVVKPLNVEFQA